MSERDDKQVNAPQRPVNDDKEAWKAYWEAQDQPWRTEPEIGEERQKYLADRRTISPSIKQGSYSFKNIKLSRADVEWLLASHDNGRGPVDWNDEGQRDRNGLDLRGADLQKVNLSGLPLAGLIGGLTGSTWFYATPEQCKMAAVRMQGVLLIETQLAGAKLNQAYLNRANLFRSNLENAELRAASLKGAYLNETCLGGTLFRRAHLEGAWLTRAHFEGIATSPADLRGAFFDNATVLTGITPGNTVHGYVQLADVSWGGVNLSRIDWSLVNMVGDEYEALQSKGKEEDRDIQITLYQTAVRANRQLAVALQTQGLNEVAARFAYRAQICQRYLLFLQLIQSLKQQIKTKWLASLLFVDKPKGEAAKHMTAIMIIMLGLFIYGFGLIIIPILPTNSIFFPSNMRDSSILLGAMIFGIFFIIVSIVSLLLYFTPKTLLALFFLFMGFIQIALPASVYFLLNVLLFHLDWLLITLECMWIILMIALLIGRFIFNAWFFIIQKIWNGTKAIFSKFRPLIGIQVAFGRYIFAWILDLIAGYGYRPGRSLIAYLLIVVGFASLYTTLGHLSPFPDSFVFSLASFHGRGFFPNFEGPKIIPLSDPLVVLATIEAVIGLIIEISFIATFTQRYFGK